MANLKRIAPIFPVSDLSASLAHYQRLGFVTRTYDKGGYGFATLDNVEIHLGGVPGGASTTPASAYLLLKTRSSWHSDGPRPGPTSDLPEDTEWGQHEGVVIDPDEDMIRVATVVARPV